MGAQTVFDKGFKTMKKRAREAESEREVSCVAKRLAAPRDRETRGQRWRDLRSQGRRKREAGGQSNERLFFWNNAKR
jgi:hypothetical protein